MFIISPLKRVGSQSSRTNVKYSAAVVLKSIFRFDRIIPESVPWLIAKSRDEEAKTILETAARWNGIDLPQKFRSKCNAAAQYVKGEDMDSHQHHPLGRIMKRNQINAQWSTRSLIYLDRRHSSDTCWCYSACGKQTVVRSLH